MATTTGTRPLGTVGPASAGFDRRALAVLMPIGPLAIGAVRALLPSNTGDSNTVMAAKVAAHQGPESAVIWLMLLALVTVIPGVIALGLLARRHAPRLGTVALVVSFIGFASLFWSNVAGGDNVALAAARIGTSPVSTGKLLDSLGHITAVGLASDLFVIGHTLGLILLGIALWRGRAVPAWAALAIAVSMVFHFVFAVIVPVHVLDGLAWAAAAAGFAAAGLALVREPGTASA
jgi:hypothetical protein